MKAADYGLRRITRPGFACLVCFEDLCRRAFAGAQKAGQVVSKENGIADSGKILAFVTYSCDAMLCHECFLVNLRPVRVPPSGGSSSEASASGAHPPAALPGHQPQRPFHRQTRGRLFGNCVVWVQSPTPEIRPLA